VGNYGTKPYCKYIDINISLQKCIICACRKISGPTVTNVGLNQGCNLSSVLFKITGKQELQMKSSCHISPELM
jgi:hypothetical protein